MSDIGAEINRAIKSHAEVFERAKLPASAPNYLQVEASLDNNPSMCQTIEHGGELLIVPVSLDRDSLVRAAAGFLYESDVSENFDTEPIVESPLIGAAKASDLLLINTRDYRHQERGRGGRTPDQYAAAPRQIEGFDLLALTPDAVINDIPRRLCGADVSAYHKATRSGVLKASIGTYKEYLALVMQKAHEGQVIDRKTSTWLPLAYVAGKVGIAGYSSSGNGAYILDAKAPTQEKALGVRTAVREITSPLYSHK